MTSLGQKIKRLRKERKITQQELAEGLVTSSMISQVEADKAVPSPKLLKQIAQRLGVDPDYLIEDLSIKSDQMHTFRRAKALMESEQFAEALPLLLTLVDPVAPQFHEENLCNDIAQCYVRLGQIDEAVQMYERVVRASLAREDVRTAVHAYYHLGHLERKRNHVALARMFWQRASELLRRHPDVSMPIHLKIELSLARALLEARQFDLALDSYRVAAQLAEAYSSTLDLAAVQHGIATVYMETHRFERAFVHSEQARVLYEAAHHQRGINQCHINFAIILRKQGRVLDAYQALCECIASHDMQHDPIRLANALGQRALCNLDLDQFESAIEDATKAMSLDKDNYELHVDMYQVLGRAYFATGQFNDALQLCTRAVQLAQTRSDFTFMTRMRRLQIETLNEMGHISDMLQTADTLADTVRTLF